MEKLYVVANFGKATFSHPMSCQQALDLYDGRGGAAKGYSVVGTSHVPQTGDFVINDEGYLCESYGEVFMEEGYHADFVNSAFITVWIKGERINDAKFSRAEDGSLVVVANNKTHSIWYN